MLERFVKQTHFTSQEDFIKNFKIEVPENFNFGYDVVDAWAAEEPDFRMPISRNIQTRQHLIFRASVSVMATRLCLS